MAKTRLRPERREDALSRDRIVDAAVQLLDDEGEVGLTFRALATRLKTGAGAIYWHVASKNELLVAATDSIVARVFGEVGAKGTPRKRIRDIAVGVFEAIDAHPWVGAQLSRGPWQMATLQIFERVGRELQALRVPRGAQFTAASTLVSYILGVSGQNAGNSGLEPNTDRTGFLAAEAARWRALDAQDYSFIRTVESDLSQHDDRAEFLAGIELILAGITASS